MAQEGMAIKCKLTVQYKSLTLIKYGQVGSLTTATPLSRKHYAAVEFQNFEKNSLQTFINRA